MAEEEIFYINYKGEKAKVTTIQDGAKIFFAVYLKSPVIIAEGVVGEEFVWYDVKEGVTPLAAELGAIIEDMDI